MRLNLTLPAAVLSLLFAIPAGAATVRSYHIGNSLTNMPLLGVAPGMDLPAQAASAGDTADIGYHIKCGESLGGIWVNPTDTCVTPNRYGYFKPALANNTWDAVTFQPFLDPRDEARSTINDMAGVLRSNPTNAQTKLFVYQAWPQSLGAKDYSNEWNAAYTGGIDMFHRDYYPQLVTDLRSDQGPNVYLIPAGEVLYRIDQLAKAGQVPGISSVKDWYIDPAHLNGYGNLVATETMYATMFGKNPSELATLPAVDPVLKSIIDREVWSVVNADSLTGVGVPEPSVALTIASFSMIAFTRRRRQHCR